MNDLLKTAETAGNALLGFLSKHVNDLGAIVSGLSTVANALPLNAGDKAHVADVLAKLETASANIANFVAHVGTLADGGAPAQVHISEADIETAVRNVLPDVLASLAAAHPTPAPLPTATADTAGQGA